MSGERYIVVEFPCGIFAVWDDVEKKEAGNANTREIAQAAADALNEKVSA